MKKIFPTLFVAGLTLVISSNLIAPFVADNGSDESTRETTRCKLALPPNTCYVEINCDDGCLVKKGETGLPQKNFKDYVTLNATTPFTFSLTEQGLDNPTLAFNVDNDPTKSVGYIYDPDLGTFELTPTSCQHVVIDAYSQTPAIEIHYDEKITGQQIAFSYTGSIKAVDFGNGYAFRPIDSRTNIIDGELFPRDGGPRVKIYGNCSSIAFDPLSELFKAASCVREIYFNYGVTSINIMMFTQLTNVRKLYIGADIKEIVVPSEIDKMLERGALSFYDLEEIVVSKDNPYFDSRENCKCLIDSRTNELIIGGANGFVPGGVKTIKTAAFAGNRRLSYLRLPASVETIEEFAFIHSSIAYIELSANLKTVKRMAFAYCNMLSTVDFSNLTHSPFMTPEAFYESYGIPALLAKKYDTYAPFIHKNPEIMIDIYSEAEKYGWSRQPEWFSTSLKTVPSSIIVNKLRPDYGGGEEFGGYFSYGDHASYRGCLFANPINPEFSTDYGVSYWAGYDESGDWDKNDHLSAYCVNVYSVYEKEVSEEEFAYNYESLNMQFSREDNDYEKQEVVHNVLGQDADDIKFIKYFGAYGGAYDEKTRILPYSYYGLTSLEEFIFADYNIIEKTEGALSTIDEYAFDNTGLKSLVIPDSVEYIKCFAFADCPNLVSVNFSESYPRIYGLSFANDTSLTAVNITEGMRLERGPDNMHFVNPFSGCISLRNIQCGSSSEFSLDRNGVLFSKNADGFICAPNNVSVLQTDCQPSQICAGCFTTSSASAIGPFVDESYTKGINPLSPYAFAYSKVKKIKFNALDRLYNYMFAYCPNLETIDLTSLEGPSGYTFRSEIESRTIMYKSNPDYHILVKKGLGNRFADWFMENDLYDFLEHIVEASD